MTSLTKTLEKLLILGTKIAFIDWAQRRVQPLKALRGLRMTVCATTVRELARSLTPTQANLVKEQLSLSGVTP